MIYDLIIKVLLNWIEPPPPIKSWIDFNCSWPKWNWNQRQKIHKLRCSQCRLGESVKSQRQNSCGTGRPTSAPAGLTYPVHEHRAIPAGLSSRQQFAQQRLQVQSFHSVLWSVPCTWHQVNYDFMSAVRLFNYNANSWFCQFFFLFFKNFWPTNDSPTSDLGTTRLFFNQQAWELSTEKTSETRGFWGHAPLYFLSGLHSNLCNLGAFGCIKSGCSKEKIPTFNASQPCSSSEILFLPHSHIWLPNLGKSRNLWQFVPDQWITGKSSHDFKNTQWDCAFHICYDWVWLIVWYW